jgi:hypothetical protein
VGLKCDKFGARKDINGRWSTLSHHATQQNPTLVNVLENNSAKNIFVRTMKTNGKSNKTFIPPITYKAISKQ